MKVIAIYQRADANPFLESECNYKRVTGGITPNRYKYEDRISRNTVHRIPDSETDRRNRLVMVVGNCPDMGFVRALVWDYRPD